MRRHRTLSSSSVPAPFPPSAPESPTMAQSRSLRLSTRPSSPSALAFAVTQSGSSTSIEGEPNIRAHRPRRRADCPRTRSQYSKMAAARTLWELDQLLDTLLMEPHLPFLLLLVPDATMCSLSLGSRHPPETLGWRPSHSTLAPWRGIRSENKSLAARHAYLLHAHEPAIKLPLSGHARQATSYRLPSPPPCFRLESEHPGYVRQAQRASTANLAHVPAAALPARSRPSCQLPD
ncbi:hypothetical protein C8T65DRAFT_656394 [Cerioporus squamosus]|nr:hypothetical protein C8T65DRAFT_656394 [Cerioporus squamosus]